ncbi:MAG: alkaline invertase [Cyanobacteria bacterium CRU_2_1]|nr:alkaline invertase [Cyanobacteria bacterium RU_5_0]NJR60532.1 alkaline invertase [Cyanobacteria bacterium CRU_2_1]
MSEESIVQIAQSLIHEQAMVQFQGEAVGAIAAIPKPSQAVQPDLNYGEIFIRDNVPVMVYFLMQGKAEVVRHFLQTCLSLQSQQFETRGIFPTSFVETNGQVVADYGQRAIGRVVSADATLWWAILAHMYVRRTGDRAFALQHQVQVGLQCFLDLILRPSFRGVPTLYVPDGAFMIDRPLDVWGTPLEIQVLLYGSLLSAASLIQMDLVNKGYLNPKSKIQNPKSPDPFTQNQINQFHLSLDWAKRLRRYLLKNYWVMSKTVQVLRRRPTEQYGDAIENEYNIQTETIPHWLQDWLGDRGGYLIGNIRTGRPDFRFFTMGNCLGAIFDVISFRQQQALFRLILQNQQDLIAEMPMRICHPPLSDEDWRKKTGYDRKNLPWCYHNAGHWPCLFWFLVVAVLRHQHHHQRQDRQLMIEMNGLLEDAYQLLLKQLPRQHWAEYFDGPIGNWMGQQARVYQTWTIVGFLLVHHLLKVNRSDAQILDVPSIQSLL